MRYFKRKWEEVRGDKYDFWGTSLWYFEVGDDLYVKRQLELYENGRILKYSEDLIEDEFGGLADQVVDEEDFEGMDISSYEFELVWSK
jgi:hypothetical protein